MQNAQEASNHTGQEFQGLLFAAKTIKKPKDPLLKLDFPTRKHNGIQKKRGA